LRHQGIKEEVPKPQLQTKRQARLQVSQAETQGGHSKGLRPKRVQPARSVARQIAKPASKQLHSQVLSSATAPKRSKAGEKPQQTPEQESPQAST